MEDEEEHYSSDEEFAEENELEADEEEGRSENEGLFDDDLVSRFFRSYNKTGKVCQPVFDQKVGGIARASNKIS